MDLIEEDYFGLQFMDKHQVAHWLDKTKASFHSQQLVDNKCLNFKTSSENQKANHNHTADVPLPRKILHFGAGNSQRRAHSLSVLPPAKTRYSKRQASLQPRKGRYSKI